MKFDGYGIGCGVCGLEIYLTPRAYNFEFFKTSVFNYRGEEDLVPETMALNSYIDCGLVTIAPFYSVTVPPANPDIPIEFYSSVTGPYVYSSTVQYVPSGNGGMIPVYSNKKYTKTDTHVLKTQAEIKTQLNKLFEDYRKEREVIAIELPNDTTVTGTLENRKTLYKGYIGLKNGAFNEFVTRIDNKWVVLNVTQAEAIFKFMASHFNTCYAANKNLEDIVTPLATSAELIAVFNTYKTTFNEFYKTKLGVYPPGVEEEEDPVVPPGNPNIPVFSNYVLDGTDVILGALTYTHPDSVLLKEYYYQILDNANAVVFTSPTATDVSLLVSNELALMDIYEGAPASVYKFKFFVKDTNDNVNSAVIFNYTTPASVPVAPVLSALDSTTDVLSLTIGAYSHPYDKALGSVVVTIYESVITEPAHTVTFDSVGIKTIDVADVAITPALVATTEYKISAKFIDADTISSTQSNILTFTKL